MDPTIRLRIATRIHFALLRHYGEDVAVSSLLRSEATGREALWVCEASGLEELVTLAGQFETATRQEARAAQLLAREAKAAAATRGTAPQEMAWSRDTSGFGVSRLHEAMGEPAARGGNWFKPSTWLAA